MDFSLSPVILLSSYLRILRKTALSMDSAVLCVIKHKIWEVKRMEYGIDYLVKYTEKYGASLSFLWENGKGPLLFFGGLVLAGNLLWLLVHLLYGEVFIYNLKEGKQYQYLGSLWIERKGGEYTLLIPDGLIEKSHTTQYKLRSGRVFLRLHRGKMLCIRFGGKYQTFLPLAREMIAKNHVATSHKL